MQQVCYTCVFNTFVHKLNALLRVAKPFNPVIKHSSLIRYYFIHDIVNRTYSSLTVHHSQTYSVLKLFTGFVIAALIAWKLTVANAITTASTPASTNVHTLTSIR